MPEKSEFYYKDELSRIERCTDEEMQQLIVKMNAGDIRAENRMIEGNLYRVYEAASFFASPEMPFSDLVQEGNLALVLCVRTLKPGDLYESVILKAIQNAMTDFIDSEAENHKASKTLSDAINKMDEICMKIAEEKGREATLEEIGEAMQMDPSDVKYLMQITLAALEREA